MAPSRPLSSFVDELLDKYDVPSDRCTFDDVLIEYEYNGQLCLFRSQTPMSYPILMQEMSTHRCDQLIEGHISVVLPYGKQMQIVLSPVQFYATY